MPRVNCWNPVLAEFTEGFATADLKTAETLLSEL